MEVEQIAAPLGQVVFDGPLVGFDEAETAIQMVERQSRVMQIEQLGQGGARYPGVNAAFAARIDQAVDGDEGGDLGHGHARGHASQQSLQEAVEAEILPGAEADVDVAEPAGMPPGNRRGQDLDGGDRAGGGGGGT